MPQPFLVPWGQTKLSWLLKYWCLKEVLCFWTLDWGCWGPSCHLAIQMHTFPHMSTPFFLYPTQETAVLSDTDLRGLQVSFFVKALNLFTILEPVWDLYAGSIVKQNQCYCLTLLLPDCHCLIWYRTTEDKGEWLFWPALCTHSEKVHRSQKNFPKIWPKIY